MLLDPHWFPQSWPRFALTFAGSTICIVLRYYLMIWPIHHFLWKENDKKVNEKHLKIWGIHILTARRLTKRQPTEETIRHERRLSDKSAFVYAFPAAWVFERWRCGVGTVLYGGVPQRLTDWCWIPLSCVIFILVQDAHFYWTHRWMHSKWLYKHMHKGHHESIQPTPWASFSFDLAEACSAAWLLPALACYVPIHVFAALALLIFMTWQAIWNHAGWEIYNPDGLWCRFMISARHHNLHHTTYVQHEIRLDLWALLSVLGPTLCDRPRTANARGSERLSGAL